MLTHAYLELEDEPRTDRGAKCKACGGRLVTLVEILAHGQRHQQDHRPRTKYLACERCAQIQIFDEEARYVRLSQ
jgi:uncharacterized protein with PIN domain